MATLQEQLLKANKLDPQAIIFALFKYLGSIEKYIVDLNKEQIFKESIDIFGDPLGYYSRASEYITTNEALLGLDTKIKREGDPYDFEQKGIFKNSLFITALGSSEIITFGSSDPKLDDILSNSRLLSKSFFGLTEENKLKLLKEKLTPFIIAYSRKVLVL